MADALAIVPNYSSTGGDIEMLDATLRSLRAKTPDDDLDIVVVDDASPMDLRPAVYTTTAQHGGIVGQMPENGGFSRSVNFGLNMALEAGQDAADVAGVVANYWIQP